MKVFRLLNSTGARLLIFNSLLLFLPLGAFMTLDVFESQMLRQQEETMVAQGRVIAAALQSLAPEQFATNAQRLLKNLDSRSTSRLRIIDLQGQVLADSVKAETLGPSSPSPTASSKAKTEPSPLYDFGSAPFRFIRTLLGAPDGNIAPPDDRLQIPKNPALLKALKGSYGAYTTISRAQRSVTLYSAFPITSANGQVQGAVLISLSTYRLLRDMYQIRLDIFKIFLVSIGIAAILGLVASLSISRPLRRLSKQAENFLDQDGRIGGSFAPLKGLQEIRDLSSALHHLGQELQNHLRFTESFAADLAHEAKNPLSAILCAADILVDTNNQTTQAFELGQIIRTEGQRLENILEAAGELVHIDVAVARAPCKAIDIHQFLSTVQRTWQVRNQIIALDCTALTPRSHIYGHAGFLEQAIEKLIDNALDFSPPQRSIFVYGSNDQHWVYIDVIDDGPGIAPDQQDRIFERFHCGRSGAKGIHLGLGLTIARSIIQAWGGSLECVNGGQLAHGHSGAVFRCRLALHGAN